MVVSYGNRAQWREKVWYKANYIVGLLLKYEVAGLATYVYTEVELFFLGSEKTSLNGNYSGCLQRLYL